MIFFLLLFLIAPLLSIGIGRMIGDMASDWSLLRRSAIAALPIPALMTVAGALIAFLAVLSTERECGVDACGTAMVGAMSTIGLAIALHVFSTLVTSLVLLAWER